MKNNKKEKKTLQLLLFQKAMKIIAFEFNVYN